MKKLIAAAVTLVTALAVVAVAAADNGNSKGDDGHGSGRGSAPVTYAVIGDTPYGAAQIANFPNDVAEINADPNVSLVLHLGDIKNGSTVCSDEYFNLIRTGFNAFVDPLVYTPGDNEWTDCHRANNGGYLPAERLAKIRQVFFDNPGQTLGQHAIEVESQDESFVENVRWSQAGVVFGTLNVPGSNNDWQPWFGTARTAEQALLQTAEFTVRDAADRSWLKQVFRTATKQDAKAVVLGIQADLWDPAFSGANADPASFDHFTAFVNELARQALAFGKPVLLLNGDSHKFTDDYPLSASAPAYQKTMYGLTQDVPNLRRITINGSTTPCHEWLKLTVDPGTTGIFTYQRTRYHNQPGFPLSCAA
jgi:hypothetical protein